MNYAFAFFSLLVGFTPLVTMNAAHHMLTFACASPGSNKQVWLVEKCHLANKKKHSILLGHRVKHVAVRSS